MTRVCGGLPIQLRLMAFLIFLSSPVVALAAEIDVISLGPNKPSLVSIKGVIELGDEDQFLSENRPRHKCNNRFQQRRWQSRRGHSNRRIDQVAKFRKPCA